MRVVPTSNPTAWARSFLSAQTEVGTRWAYWRSEFFTWVPTGVWEKLSRAAVRAVLQRFLEGCRTRAPDAEAEPDGQAATRPLAIKNGTIAELEGALSRKVTLSDAHEPPSWVSADAASVRAGIDIANVVPYLGGYLDVRTRKGHRATPDLFNLAALPFAYDGNAGAPACWLAFLAQLWPNDPESISTLQEWFGYCLTADTRQQKMLFLHGPPRSGKGTIAKVLAALVGEKYTVWPKLAELARPFGLWSWIGKSLAVISDARLTGKSDQGPLLESLLSISGEDPQTIDRKGVEHWTGKLSARIVLISNEIPQVTDVSGAFASRFITLVLEHSFLGKEDPTLHARLQPELPGILLWALDGLDRLRERGRFVQPASAAALIAEMADSTSLISAFVDERCELEAEAETAVRDLYGAWREWCEQGGHAHPGSVQAFGRNLRAAMPSVKVGRKQDARDRRRIYRGISLREVAA